MQPNMLRGILGELLVADVRGKSNIIAILQTFENFKTFKPADLHTW